MPAFAILMNSLLALFLLSACEQREFFEELAPPSVETLNGIYRVKSTPIDVTPAHAQDLSLKEGELTLRQLDSSLNLESLPLGRLEKGEGQSFSLVPTSNLVLPQNDLPFNLALREVFAENPELRVLRIGTDLKITEIRGNFRRTTTWEKVSDLEMALQEKQPLMKAMAAARLQKHLSETFLATWAQDGLQLVSVEQIKRKGSASEERSFKLASELKDEEVTTDEEGQPSKKIIRFKSLSQVSDAEPTGVPQVLINGVHKGHLELELRDRAPGQPALYVKFVSHADEASYQAASLEGWVDVTGSFVTITYVSPPEKNMNFSVEHRFSARSQRAPVPTMEVLAPQALH